MGVEEKKVMIDALHCIQITDTREYFRLRVLMKHVFVLFVKKAKAILSRPDSEHFNPLMRPGLWSNPYENPAGVGETREYMGRPPSEYRYPSSNREGSLAIVSALVIYANTPTHQHITEMR